MKKLYIADIRGHVVDGRINGHIIPVARNYKEILCHDYDVIIAAGPALLNSFKKEECLVLPYNVNDTKLKDKFLTFINFIVLLLNAKGSPIIMQQSTTITTFISIILFYWWTSPLYMIMYNTESINTWWKRIIYNLARCKIKKILCPTDRIGKAYGKKYCVVPDFFYTKKDIIIPPYEERIWDICIVGSLREDKGIVEAAKYLANSNINLLVAGKIRNMKLEKPLKYVVSSCSNIDLRIGFVNDEDYRKYIQKSKFCMLNYCGTYFDRSSGVVLDALYNGTPIIGNRCEALKVVEDYNLGILYDDIRDLDISKGHLFDNYYALLSNIRVFLADQKKYNEKIMEFIQ